jgi:Tol biopolymer transport system component
MPVNVPFDWIDFMVRNLSLCFQRTTRYAILPLLLLLCLSLYLLPLWPGVAIADPQAPATSPAQEPNPAVEEARLMTSIRQLTLEGKRAGEGYFSHDGKSMVFQSERMADNPFFQIYHLDLETGDLERVSPGKGKTTCSWIHPNGQSILFASTHEDPEAERKQKEELQLRSENKQRRYAWDYDETYEIYVSDLRSKTLKKITNARGYDAEGSWSPDGSLIAFSSNRHAFESPLSPGDAEKFARDASWQAEIYIMRSDGSEVKRLTNTLGYDGGPFFSPDGKRLCWRRFDEEGAIAEIYTMNVDGSDVKQLTKLKHMSWAPSYHPSGDYLVFATNRHGFDNFELYLVAADGSSIARVTHTPGFDGLASFDPSGKRITWTTNRTENKSSQIFVADWNDAAARELLGISPQGSDLAANTSAVISSKESPSEAGAAAARDSSQEATPEDILRHVNYLCRDELEGRLTGTPGERLATEYVASYMEQMGLLPAGDQGTFFQEFPFTSGVALGAKNMLTDGMRTQQLELNKDWRPLAFSDNGEFPAGEVVFAGYGISAPAGDGQEEYDSFVHLDIKDKWVLVFRYLPEQISAEKRQQLSRHASLRRKAMVAREKGAKGLLVVTGPATTVKEQLVPLQFDGSMGGSGLPAISLADGAVAEWFEAEGKSLLDLQKKLDSGEMVMGFPIMKARIHAVIDIEHVQKIGRNVIGRLPASPVQTGQATATATTPSSILVGAHIDHLGRGPSSSSLARDDETGAIHYGADDNASGVAAMLEMVQSLQDMRAQGKFHQVHDLLFAAWSGEEMGLLGSSYYVKELAPAGNPHAGNGSPYPAIAAYINLDMVGRLSTKLILQGISSSPIWVEEIEKRNAPLGVPITLQDDGYLPTDASTFYTRGVPILSAFTGSHSEYHTPRDKPDTLNYEGAAKVAKLLTLITRSLAAQDEIPAFIPPKVAQQERPRAALRAYLGTIPDYAESEIKGVKLSGVAGEGPASRGGIRGGDVIVKLAGKKIENIYDYTFAIEALKVGQEVEIVVQRGGEEWTVKVTPGSRE